MASPFSTAADYADALLTARRAKSLLFFVLLICLLGQVAIFFLARYTAVLDVSPAAIDPAAGGSIAGGVLNYLLILGTFVGLVASLGLCLVLLLIEIIMLVGRLIGVARVTSAWIWSALLVVLLFPWQSFLISPTGRAPTSRNVDEYKVPGVLYTWTELSHPDLGAKFKAEPLEVAILRWARFVGFPLVAVLMLLTVQVKSNRGLRQALGESPSEPMAAADVPTV
ncbi:MAG TPA: hypothetical protein VK324_13940 [Tepidisphaeraceae bacterium]|nr:hypothetical protein [Tepidisphaeraceae bacterium]